MRRELRDWTLVCFVVGAVLAVLGARRWMSPDLPPHAVGEPPLVVATGLVLVIVAAAAAAWRGRLLALLDADPGPRDVPRARLRLFVVSFVALFLELALIRYAGSQFRVFSFYKNVPLIAAYLGLGLGCALGGGDARSVLRVLLWIVPLAAWLSVGPLVVGDALGHMVAVASSEHVLGDAAIPDPGGVASLLGQVAMGAFCVGMLVVFALLFVPLGRVLGAAFEGLPRLSAYSLNILGSLAGTVAFLVLGWLWAPPSVWFLVALVPLLGWVARPAEQRRFALALIALAAVAVAPRVGNTIWSPYQKLVGHEVSMSTGPGRPEMAGYLVDISDVFYQVAVDLRPDAIARLGSNPFPHYDQTFRILSAPPERVLVVGAGTGNDVAAALRAGARAVDAVDIDPAIVGLGRRHHPERPYDDARVHVIVDDARAAFRHLPAASYDAVVFGLLDSHTQLGVSSVRLDNYVFTRESFTEALRLLRPEGWLVVTAATFRPWFRQRFIDLLATACGTPVRIEGSAPWVTYACRPGTGDGAPVPVASAAALPTDDWPFLYLPVRRVPAAYLVAIVFLALTSALLVRASGLTPARFGAYHGHLFLLGAAFLLMEVYAINRLALLFGTTWVVSAVAIMIVLTLIVAANVTVALVGRVPYGLAYAGLALGLVASFAIEPSAVLGRGAGPALAYAFGVLVPVYFAGLVFARSFARAPEAGPALGANMLGAVVGGWSEYATMAVGIRALALLALALYAGSALCLARMPPGDDAR